MYSFKSDILNKNQLLKLKEHKYSAEGTSVLEPIFQPFWRWTVEQIPRWIAPNLLTLFGLACNILPIAVLLYESPQARNEVSAVSLIASAIGMFLYQVLDAIDGKQARRTGTSSPLGELFDHGCDSVSSMMCAIGLCCTLMTGRNPSGMFPIFFIGISMFYVAHWQGYVRGILSFGRIDVTETQVLYMVLYFLTAIVGCSFWEQKFFYLNNRDLLMLGCIVPMVYHHTRMFRLILAGGQGKNGSTVADTSILSPAIPLGIVVTCALYVFKHSQNNLFQTEPLFTCSLFGFVLTKLSCKLIVASMTKSSFDMLDITMVGPLTLAVINYLGLLSHHEYLLLVVLIILVCIDLVYYAVKVCQEICQYLDINCLTIPSDMSKKKD